MSTLHTPVPLRVARAKNGGGDFAVMDAANNIVAECFEDIREQGECASDEAKANATLYAAAPALLAVLMKLRRGDLHQRARHLYDEAQAAISKAAGETA